MDRLNLTIEQVTKKFRHTKRQFIEKWSRYLVDFMSHYQQDVHFKFELVDIVARLTEDDILLLKLPSATSADLSLPADMQSDIQSERLQSPDITFGKTVRAAMCPKCKLSEMTMQAIQKRAIDEPTQYFYQCLSSQCGFTYKL